MDRSPTSHCPEIKICTRIGNVPRRTIPGDNNGFCCDASWIAGTRPNLFLPFHRQNGTPPDRPLPGPRSLLSTGLPISVARLYDGILSLLRFVDRRDLNYSIKRERKASPPRPSFRQPRVEAHRWKLLTALLVAALWPLLASRTGIVVAIEE